MRHWLALILALSFLPEMASAESWSKHACHPKKEKWVFSKGIRPKWRAKFLEFQRKKLSNVGSFAEAITLRKSLISNSLNSTDGPITCRVNIGYHFN